MQENTKRIIHFLLLALVVGFITFLIPQSIGLGAGGFDTQAVLQQFGFYQVGGIFLVLLVIAFIINLVIKKGDERYGSSVAFADQGEIPHVPWFKKFSSLQLFLLSTIIFGIIFLGISTVRQTSFIGYKSLEQQFTPTAELMFSSLLIPGSENLGMAIVLAILLIGLGFWARKTNMGKTNFIILAYFAAFIGGLYWVINHLLRYGGQDYNIGVVFIFGFTMALLTMITGSFIPAFVMHMTNNLFFDMASLFSRDNVIIIVIGGLILLSVLYFIIYRKRKNKPVEVY